MRILLTGGAGFIGSNLVHYLLGPGGREAGCVIDLVVNLDKLTYAGNPENLAAVAGDSRHLFVHGDICDAELVRRLLTENRIDAIMHLAAESHVDRSIDSPGDFIQTNFVGTFRLLEAARAHAKNRDGFRFLHVSTDEVYGALGPADPAFCETTPYAPNSPYSASKAGSDFLVRAYLHTYGLDVVTTNCSNNYGPFQFPEKLVPLIIRKIMRGETLPVYGDGMQVRDWLFVEDHCRGLLASLLRGRAGETYCIGGRSEKPNIEVVRTLIRIVTERLPARDRKRPEELISHVKDRPGHDRRYAIDCSKIEREFGWRPQETFETGMTRTVDWYFANQSWVEHIERGTYGGERLGVG
ncbi:MAG: dTDP-glucose 4,6-dehydratase [Verrucomicrobiales bacterium]